ncbi:hypothetical protein [Kibdelosporangium phytohabitans]|nr:hypothetical protein [Kibdelosporangium phytohabitans]
MPDLLAPTPPVPQSQRAGHPSTRGDTASPPDPAFGVPAER